MRRNSLRYVNVQIDVVIYVNHSSLNHQSNDCLFLFLNQESSQRNLVSFENTGLDFEVDLTDLETFGEMTPIKTSKVNKMQNEKDAAVKSKKSSHLLSKSNRSSEHLVNISSSSLEEMNTSLTDMDDPMTEQTTRPLLSESQRQDCAQKSDEHLALTGDSDDEKLVIDDSVSPAATPTTQLKHKTTPSPITSVSETVNSEFSSPQKGTRRTRQSKKSKVSGDQLGEILRMQTAMFNSASDTAKCSTILSETNSSTRNIGPSVHSHPASLVKSCVTSYLERNQNQDGETSASPLKSAPLVNVITTEHKS